MPGSASQNFGNKLYFNMRIIRVRILIAKRWCMHVYPIRTWFIIHTEQLVYELYRFLDIYAAWFHVYRRFFMFRKFLKVLPKADGKSKLDWQNYWVERSRPLWSDETKAFLDQLVQPVPGPFRDIAKHSIAAEIGKSQSRAMQKKLLAITVLKVT